MLILTNYLWNSVRATLVHDYLQGLGIWRESQPLFCLRWKHFFISLCLSLAFCPLPQAPCFWHEFITVPWASGFPVLVAFGNQSKSLSQASPDRTETKSQGSREKVMWPGKRMKKFPITVSSKILPLWGEHLGNTHTHHEFSPLSCKRKESRNKCSFFMFVDILTFWTSLVAQWMRIHQPMQGI